MFSRCRRSDCGCDSNSADRYHVVDETLCAEDVVDATHEQQSRSQRVLWECFRSLPGLDYGPLTGHTGRLIQRSLCLPTVCGTVHRLGQRSRPIRTVVHKYSTFLSSVRLCLYHRHIRLHSKRYTRTCLVLDVLCRLLRTLMREKRVACSAFNQPEWTDRLVSSSFSCRVVSVSCRLLW